MSHLKFTAAGRIGAPAIRRDPLADSDLSLDAWA